MFKRFVLPAALALGALAVTTPAHAGGNWSVDLRLPIAFGVLAPPHQPQRVYAPAPEGEARMVVYRDDRREDCDPDEARWVQRGRDWRDDRGGWHRDRRDFERRDFDRDDGRRDPRWERRDDGYGDRNDPYR